MHTFLLSCSSSRQICIDIEDYVGLEDDSHYRMIIEIPNEPNSADTIYWQGSKRFRYAMKESYDNCLSFVEVSELNDRDHFEHRLFRSVAAIDGDIITIKVYKRDSVMLSGSKSNESITDFWQGKMLQGYMKNSNDNIDFNIIHDFCHNEIQNHSTDLYGAFIYSWECMLQLIDIDESIPPSIKAAMMLDEIKQSDSYISNHCVVHPFLDDIILAGDVSPLLINEFTSYMCPF